MKYQKLILPLLKNLKMKNSKLIEQPTVKIDKQSNTITFFNWVNQSGQYMQLSEAEAALYYIELHKFLFKDKEQELK